MAAARRALIVLAHQEPGSFNHRAAVEALESGGWSVAVSDLYYFEPVLSRADFAGAPDDPRNLNYAKEAVLAWKEGRLSSDILGEVEKLAAADLVIFQFPLQVVRPPSHSERLVRPDPHPGLCLLPRRYVRPGALPGPLMLALSLSAVCGYGGHGRAPSPAWLHLAQSGSSGGDRTLPACFACLQKKALLSFTTGGRGSMYTPAGISGDINILLWPIQSGTLHFCGFQVLAPQIALSIGQHTLEDVCSQILEDWKRRLAAIWEEKPSALPKQPF